jgi:dynein heavy chain, axonemal
VHEQDQGPYVVVAVQECGRMNRLLEEMERSLLELRKGLNGQLNMSQAMEDLALVSQSVGGHPQSALRFPSPCDPLLPSPYLPQAISINEVPGRNPFQQCSWEKSAWPSRKPLASWFADLVLRVQQLQRWTRELQVPVSIWMPGLFNPTAFLTAIKQVRAAKARRALGSLCTSVEFIKACW